LQAKHGPPFIPQVSTLGSLHWSAAQHPLGQLVASQVQMPLAQRCPAAHAGPVPQVQRPSGEQASARLGSQATHAAPTAPQLANDGVLHASPAQQPVVHRSLHPLQAPASQVSPAGHVLQAPPPAPHAEGSLPRRQVAPEQHPSGQEVALHVDAASEEEAPSDVAASQSPSHARGWE